MVWWMVQCSFIRHILNTIGLEFQLIDQVRGGSSRAFWNLGASPWVLPLHHLISNLSLNLTSLKMQQLRHAPFFPPGSVSQSRIRYMSRFHTKIWSCNQMVGQPRHHLYIIYGSCPHTTTAPNAILGSGTPRPPAPSPGFFLSHHSPHTHHSRLYHTSSPPSDPDLVPSWGFFFPFVHVLYCLSPYLLVFLRSFHSGLPLSYKQTIR